MTTLLTHELRKARKPHRCIWCGHPIAIGDTYRYQTVVFECAVQSNKYHTDCFDSIDWRDVDEGFMPYDNERPPKSVRGAA